MIRMWEIQYCNIIMAQLLQIERKRKRKIILPFTPLPSSCSYPYFPSSCLVFSFPFSPLASSSGCLLLSPSFLSSSGCLLSFLLFSVHGFPSLVFPFLSSCLLFCFCLLSFLLSSAKRFSSLAFPFLSSCLLFWFCLLFSPFFFPLLNVFHHWPFPFSSLALSSGSISSSPFLLSSVKGFPSLAFLFLSCILFWFYLLFSLPPFQC